CSGASEAAAAVDQHVSFAAQKRPQFRAGLDPFLLKRIIWCLYVGDRQMEPQYVSAKYFFAETYNSQQGHLLLLQERYDSCRAPNTDRVEVECKIAIPISGHGVAVIFAGAKSNADAAEIRPGRDGGDLQRMREGCLHELLQGTQSLILMAERILMQHQ